MYCALVVLRLLEDSLFAWIVFSLYFCWFWVKSEQQPKAHLKFDLKSCGLPSWKGCGLFWFFISNPAWCPALLVLEVPIYLCNLSCFPTPNQSNLLNVADYTIGSSSLGGCTSIQGGLTISSEAAGELTLGVVNITGNLVVSQVCLLLFYCESYHHQQQNNFTFSHQTNVSSIHFPLLQEVGGIVFLVAITVFRASSFQVQSIVFCFGWTVK